jgi:hypothetical protein
MGWDVKWNFSLKVRPSRAVRNSFRLLHFFCSLNAALIKKFFFRSAFFVPIVSALAFFGIFFLLVGVLIESHNLLFNSKNGREIKINAVMDIEWNLRGRTCCFSFEGRLWIVDFNKPELGLPSLDSNHIFFCSFSHHHHHHNEIASSPTPTAKCVREWTFNPSYVVVVRTIMTFVNQNEPK